MIRKIMQLISNFPLVSARTEEQFYEDMEAFVVHGANTTVNEQNQLRNEINNTVDDINGVLDGINNNLNQIANDKITISQAVANALDAKDAAIAANNAAQTIYDTFDDRYLGVKAIAPTLDNDNNPLQSGALYFNSSSGKLFIYDSVGDKWVDISTIPTLLSSLSDVAFATKTNNDVIQYDSATGKWVNRSFYSKAELDAFIDIHTKTAKTTLDNADEIAVASSTDNFSLKKISWANIKATLLNLFVSKDANGNVGINNNAPLQKLHVCGSIIAGDTTYASINAFIGAMLNNNSTTPSLDIRRWNGSGTNHGVIKIAGNAAGAMLFFVDTKSTNVEATTERMRIDSAGNLLIGTSVTSGLDKIQIEGTFSSKAVKAFTGIDLNTLKTRTEVCSVANTCTNLPIAETGILEVIMFDSNSQWVTQRFTAIGYPTAGNQGRTFVRNWMNNNTWSAWAEK